MFSSSGLLPTMKLNLGRLPKQKKGTPIGRRRRKGTAQKLTECIGTSMNLGLRHDHESAYLPNPYGYACSLRCKHPVHLKEDHITCSGSRGKSEDFIPEYLYRKYTETDSRPLTPDLTRRSVSVPRVKSVTVSEERRCITPEPEARQCQFHHRRILILDLRRVKSVDAIGRQGSRTPGTSVDSTGDDADAGSSMLFQFSPRHLSVSRSITPKTKQRKGGMKKLKDPRSTSPIAYERSSSPKILEGKLRRHGRTHKTVKEKMDAENSGENRAGSEEVKKVDDPKETQISTIVEHENEDDFAEQSDNRSEESLDDLKHNLKNFRHSKQALYSVLDDYLAGKVWSAQDLETLDEQIDGISQEFKKLETKFQTQNIQLKESTWLGFPRTWSRSSATFSAPNDAKSLKEMKPLDYLKHFVTVSGPRKHLYSLVFQRYRTLENPTKDWIWVKTLKPALSEVLGRPFRQDDEMSQLCNYYLGVQEQEQVSELAFIGICAFCERIYADYSLEDNAECHKCYKIPTCNKQCHQNKKNHLEKADMSYLFAKLRDGQVQKHLSNMFLALCNKD